MQTWVSLLGGDLLVPPLGELPFTLTEKLAMAGLPFQLTWKPIV